MSATGAARKRDGCGSDGWKKQNFHGPGVGHGNVGNAQNLGNRLVLRRATRWWVRWELFPNRNEIVDGFLQDGRKGLTVVQCHFFIVNVVNVVVIAVIVVLLIS
jgi:hypothetical protein